jgi:hypothetical protein
VRRRPAALTCAGFACGAAALALAVTGPTETGCTTHQCDSSTYDYVNGFMEDATTFVTNAMDSPWIQYNGMTTVRIWFPKQVLGWTPKFPEVQISTDPTPNTLGSFDDGDVQSGAAGQLAVYDLLTTTPQTGADGGPFFTFDGGEFGGFLQLTNASCAPYFARVQVEFIPPGDAGTARAVAPAEAGPAEASAAAGPADAGTD